MNNFCKQFSSCYKNYCYFWQGKENRYCAGVQCAGTLRCNFLVFTQQLEDSKDNC